MIERISKNKHLWLALLVGLITILPVMLPRFLDPYSMEADFSNWYWMNRFHDPELFPNDFTVESWLITITIGPITLLIDKSSPLYSLLFQLFSPLVSAVFLGKLLAFPLAAATIYYLFRLSERLTSPLAAMAIAILFIQLNLILPSLVSIMGGFQRSFVLPLALAFIYYWQEKRYRSACIVLFLAGGLYPPLAVIFAAAMALELFLFWSGKRHTVAQWQHGLYLGGLVIVGLIGLALLWLFNGTGFLAALFNPQITIPDLSDESPYGLLGRSKLFYVFPLVGRGGIADHGITIAVLFILAIFTIALYGWQPHRWRAFPRIFKSLMVASFLGFALAWAGFLWTGSFILYLPSRYTQSTLLLILFIFVAANLPAALQASARRIAANGSAITWLSFPLAGILVFLFFFMSEAEANIPFLDPQQSRWLLLVSIGLLMLLSLWVARRAPAKQAAPRQHTTPRLTAYQRHFGAGALILMGILGSWSLQPLTNYTYRWSAPGHQEMYAYVSTLPKDAVLSGSTHVFVERIPMFGKRSVLITTERMGPTPEAIVEAVVAYYTNDPAELLAYCHKYGVSHLIVHLPDFVNVREDRTAMFSYEPYRSLIAAQIGVRDTFFLETLPDSMKDFQHNDWYITACTEALLGEMPE